MLPISEAYLTKKQKEKREVRRMCRVGSRSVECESGCVNLCDLDVEGSVTAPPLRSNMGVSHSTEHN